MMATARSSSVDLLHRLRPPQPHGGGGRGAAAARSLTNLSDDPMEVLDWFHPQLTRHAAECMLIDNAPEGTFLLRSSSDGEGYVLSVKLSSSVQHVRITIGPGGRYHFGNSSFESVRGLKRHFELEKPVIGGDSNIRVVLKFPYSRFVEESHLYTEVVHHAVTNYINDSSDSDTDSSSPSHGSSSSMTATTSTRTMAISSKEGYLTKQGRIRKTWRVRWFILRNQNLSYYRTKQHKKPLGTLDLTEAISVDLDTSKDKEFCFRIIMPSRTWYFLGNSVEDSQQWVELLRLKLARV
ncbi:Dual adapter for phosphotyrosine and 3-phosphotyrosine and 3-phosphoinositide [Geodia barretti]|uniref:Dual adapter for phosphotyrosine and 3-phosphotyrosine and 3-phosphoinositide n=1 Tax=Geodia barretti TaxID=519541 RepID=A0AA35WZU1_GEOBA|nr:Dual adapter for phosphotyrosine and 3-phosphotyrosine and 3-phosphoinositide [Geodia barretti]